MIVMKFGGSSLASAERIGRVIELVRAAQGERPLVVVSALGKCTDLLIAAAERARDGQVEIGAVASFHDALATELGLRADIFEDLPDQLTALLHGVSLTRQLTDRTRDNVLSFGERLAARLVAAAMSARGLTAVAVDAFDAGLITDSDHGAAVPVPDVEESIARELPTIEGVTVVTGFLGRDSQGNITTLGRSGSDYSASLFGAALDAQEVQIWTDVSGVMTCDPSIDDRARSLPVLSFEEASELAYYGAKVLHPATLVPAIRKGIVVRVLNTISPDDPGTRIDPAAERTSALAKSVVYKEDVCLIHIATSRLTHAVHVLARALDLLQAARIAIHMANTSEATVSLVTESGYDEARLKPAIEALASLGRVRVERDKAIVCVVGEELAGCAGVLGRIFGALAARGIKAKLVSQSASEINVTFLVDNAEIEPAVRALHELLLEES